MITPINELFPNELIEHCYACGSPIGMQHPCDFHEYGEGIYICSDCDIAFDALAEKLLQKAQELKEVKHEDN